MCQVSNLHILIPPPPLPNTPDDMVKARQIILKFVTKLYFASLVLLHHMEPSQQSCMDYNIPVTVLTLSWLPQWPEHNKASWPHWFACSHQLDIDATGSSNMCSECTLLWIVGRTLICFTLFHQSYSQNYIWHFTSISESVVCIRNQGMIIAHRDLCLTVSHIPDIVLGNTK